MPAHSSPQRWLSSIPSQGSCVALVACVALGCESKVVIANWNCPSSAKSGLLVTTATDDSTWGQWYVGNLASDLEPVDSTLFVDDLTVSATR